MVKYSNEQKLAMDSFKKFARKLVTKYPSAKYTYVRLKLKNELELSYPSLVQMKVSDDWIATRRRECGLEKKKTITNESQNEELLRWINAKIGCTFTSLTTSMVREKYKKVFHTHKNPSKGRLRNIRRSNGIDIVFNTRSKKQDLWTRKDK